MKNMVIILFIIFLQIFKAEVLPKRQRRILNGGLGEAFLFQISDKWDSLKSIGDWRNRADYNEITYKYRTEDKNGEMNETVQYFVETYAKDMRNRCKMSIYNQLEIKDVQEEDQTLGVDYLIEICNEFGSYLIKNIRLSKKFFDLEYALLFFRIHLNQKTGYMQGEVDPDFYQVLLETNKQFFEMMIKDIRSQMIEEQSEHFFNYKQLHTFYNNYWATIVVNLFRNDLKPKQS